MHANNPFSILREFINTMEYCTEELARQYGVEQLAGPQGLTVTYLLNHQEEEVFIKDIEKVLHISKSVASGLIKRMEKNGFIEVIPSLKDKRYKQVVLTELGLEKAKQTQNFHEALHRLLLADISQEELTVAHQVFMKIKKNLEKGE
ncbi:MarR family winged helix-turn-helix transcriptional regulator [Streptococcus ovis]|uniref:MarR family winged helix-turn-helix transcriptional regulator n=1 Tax=Streptococcus ovis TaxID=82806 RepID=UPI0003765D8A|nr:MarR family transcriptional regulator [Streptococcus ovis]